VLRLTFFDERADILNRLFTQPQWNNYNFASATGKMSIAPVHNASNVDAIRKACEEIGIETPVLPTDKDISGVHDPKYVHAIFHEKLANSQGYELRFYAYVDLADNQVYSQWIAALPCVIDSKGGFMNLSEGETIYSANADPNLITSDMRMFFEKNDAITP
jgi:hypothetical protein